MRNTFEFLKDLLYVICLALCIILLLSLVLSSPFEQGKYAGEFMKGYYSIILK